MLKKSLVNLFIAAWLVIILIDGGPKVGPWHEQLSRKIDPFLDVTGLWQAGWALYAPDPDKTNVSIQAHIIFEDEESVMWNSPEWRSLSTLERFQRFRECEFTDNVRFDKNHPAWRGYATYLARNISHPNDPTIKPKTVVLIRRWFVIPKPNKENILQFPEVPEKDHSFIIFADDIEL